MIDSNTEDVHTAVPADGGARTDDHALAYRPTATRSPQGFEVGPVAAGASNLDVFVPREFPHETSS